MGLYRKLLGDFAAKYAAFGETLHQQAKEDSQAARRLVHTLKGVAGNLGAMAADTMPRGAIQASRCRSPGASFEPMAHNWTLMGRARN